MIRGMRPIASDWFRAARLERWIVGWPNAYTFVLWSPVQGEHYDVVCEETVEFRFRRSSAAQETWATGVQVDDIFADEEAADGLRNILMVLIEEGSKDPVELTIVCHRVTVRRTVHQP